MWPVTARMPAGEQNDPALTASIPYAFASLLMLYRGRITPMFPVSVVRWQ